MKLSVRELQSSDIENIVDYFLNADAGYLKSMGAEKVNYLQRKYG
ncbi:hypothetical protein [Maribacter litoralis]|nr:hypothetical protein [Maribacter litoralis]